jgi:hypothetical protein
MARVSAGNQLLPRRVRSLRLQCAKSHFESGPRPRFFLSKKPAILSRATIIYLLAEARCLDREICLFLKARVPARDQKASGVYLADGFDPVCFRLGKVAQKRSRGRAPCHGIAAADPHKAIGVADMRAD